MTGLVFALLLASSGELTKHERCIRAAVFKEAGAEPLAGMKAVRQVIRNRARESGKGWCNTIKEPRQFSFYKRGMILSEVKLDKKWLTKYEKSVKMRPVVPECTTHFHAKSVQPSWAKSKRLVAEIGQHKYYC